MSSTKVRSSVPRLSAAFTATWLSARLSADVLDSDFAHARLQATLPSSPMSSGSQPEEYKARSAAGALCAIQI